MIVILNLVASSFYVHNMCDIVFVIYHLMENFWMFWLSQISYILKIFLIKFLLETEIS